MSSTTTTKIPSKQFHYQERDIQIFPDFFTREFCLLSKLQSNATLKGSLIPSPKAVQAGAHSWRPWALPHHSAGSDALTVGTGAACKHRGTPLLHMFFPLRNGGAAERQWLWPISWLRLHLTLLFPSSGFLGLLPSCNERHLSPQPQHYKRTRKVNPPPTHLRETLALLVSLCGCCQPFHTSHLYSFLVGACSLPRHH